MGLIKDFIQKFRGKNQREKELEEEMQIQNRVVEKTKSANERELERYGKEAREKMIEKRVKWERAKRTKEIWKANLLKNNAHAYINDSILKEKNKFLRGEKIW